MRDRYVKKPEHEKTMQAALRAVEKKQLTRGTEISTLLWYREEYLVVLSQRRSEEQNRAYWLLKTAYCTDKSGRVTQLQRERDAFLRAYRGGSQND